MSSAAKRAKNEAAIKGISPEQAAHEENLDAEIEQENRQRPALSSKFKIKKRITLPSLVIKTGVAMYLRINTPITISSVIDPSKPNQTPAHVCEVTDLENGENSILLVNSVIEANLNEKYGPGDADTLPGYVGLSFQFANLGKRRGKNYFDFEISEVEMSDD